MIEGPIAVTGANGSLGRAVCRLLVSKGIEVWGLVRPGHQLEPQVRPLVLGHYDDQSLDALNGPEKFRAMIHLAAYGIAPDQRNFTDMFAVNVAGTQAVVRFAASRGAARILLAGSCAEYADDANLPLNPKAPLQSARLYGASKAAASLTGLALAKALGVEGVVLRIFNVYGPDEAGHRLLPSLFNSLTKGQRTSLSPGHQLRDFIHVDDVAASFVAALEAPDIGGKVFDICTGKATSVREFAETFAKTIGADPSLLGFGDLPMRADDIIEIRGDPSLMQLGLGFTPQYTVAKGIENTVVRMTAKQKGGQ